MELHGSELTRYDNVVYTPELGQKFYQLIVAQNCTVKKAAEAIGANLGAVVEWTKSHEDFAQIYARAREGRAHGLVEEILEIADSDMLMSDDKRIRIDARKWIASKLLPREYGDKTTIDNNVNVTLAQLVEQSYKIVEQRAEKVEQQEQIEAPKAATLDILAELGASTSQVKAVNEPTKS